jgi:hypothetical protein
LNEPPTWRVPLTVIVPSTDVLLACRVAPADTTRVAPDMTCSELQLDVPVTTGAWSVPPGIVALTEAVGTPADQFAASPKLELAAPVQVVWATSACAPMSTTATDK